MNYEAYHWIFIGGAVLAGLMLVLTVLLFFLLQIPRVIGDLTGSTARKAIEDIRQQNAQTGVKVHKSSQVNRERGKVTAKISPSGQVQQQQTGGAGGMKTGKLSTQKLSREAAETTLLDQPASETTVLDQPAAETTVLAQPGDETTLLTPQTWAAPAPAAGTAAMMNDPGNETTLLSSQSWAAPAAAPAAPYAAPQAPAYTGSPFVIEYELTLIHSDELIA